MRHLTLGGSARASRATPPNPQHAARLGLISAALLAACANPTPVAPQQPPSAKLAESFVAAIDAEAADPLASAKYLDAIDRAVANGRDPEALATVVASLDALAFREVEALGLPGEQAVAYRSRDGMPAVVERLRAAWTAAGERLAQGDDPGVLPVMRGKLATALHELAMYVGQEQAAMVWGERRGCAREAALVAPLDFAALRGLAEPSQVVPTGAFGATYPGARPFFAEVTPYVVRADACALDVNATFSLPGVRAVVVDIENPREQTVFVSLASRSAAVVDVAGTRVIRRGFEAGDGAVTRLGRVSLPVGRARVVVRVGQMSDGDQIELDVWGDDGLPLPLRAPKAGDVATVSRASGAAPIEITASRAGDATLALTTAALLGLGEARVAEHLLEERGLPETSSPRVFLLAARATAKADDLPDSKQIERLRAYTEKTLAAWPKAWEALVTRAALTERRRVVEGLADALGELGVRPPASGQAVDKPTAEKAVTDPMTLTYVAAAAKRGQMLDVAEEAYRALETAVPGSPLLARVDTYLHGRVGADAVKAACAGGTGRAYLPCMHAHKQRGDARAALEELGRVRRLRSAPDAFRDAEVGLHVLAGDLDAAIAAYDATPPARRRLLDALGFAAGRNRSDLVRPRLERDQRVAVDTPYAIPILRRILALEPDQARELEAEGARLVSADRATNVMPGAGTAVLRHVERYAVDAGGVLRYLVYDLRRVSGTTDVAEGADSYGPSIEANAAQRLLRRRIHKRDGRVVEPDQVAAEQSHSDLSELEKGDYVEQILEGFVLPDAGGQIVVDGPDLLPARTGVREAEIELRRPASLALGLWSHPLLGKPQVRTDKGDEVRVWRIENKEPRRIEDGVPRLEQAVTISFGTQTWANLGRLLDDHVRALEDKDPYVARFAREAAGSVTAPSRALVERVVTAVGKRVKVPGGGELSDVSAMYGTGPQQTTARTVLELGQGSRALVVWRALRELGVDARLAIAETEPFSGAADFPPHVGRFRYPLVVARLPEGELWIDADVDGPPLPPGRVSPELRGRNAILPDGSLVTVQGDASEKGDEVEIRLALDASGVARGTFSIALRGREAQSLADSLDMVVGTDRREMLRNVVLTWVPWADVEDVELGSSEGSWEVSVRAKIAIFGYSQPETRDGKTWLLPGLEPMHLARGFSSTLASFYASRAGRESALTIDRPLQYRVRRRIELPKGATVARAPSSVKVAHEGFSASREGSYKEGVIEEAFLLDLPTGTVSAGEYDSFVERVRAVDDGFMAGTRVKVSP
ncbi:hypothetical protein [Polyangium mundeleinium]|uniref:DUF3857 domain-containing protein n=1 Tax=Polyangium mundeleinium TaxID=2995306 RepID=A0ABT5EED7_9BACT|nr:hypothetical protein [Polyangium mundeleinium]MDC0740177.1 hypothetical protein [Polyangium mundeleinium]